MRIRGENERISMTRLVRRSLTSISTCAVQCGAVSFPRRRCVCACLQGEERISSSFAFPDENRTPIKYVHLIFGFSSLQLTNKTELSRTSILLLTLSFCMLCNASLPLSLAASNKCDTSKIEARLAFSSRYDDHLFLLKILSAVSFLLVFPLAVCLVFCRMCVRVNESELMDTF